MYLGLENLASIGGTKIQIFDRWPIYSQTYSQTDARLMDAGGLGLAAIQIIEAAGALPIATAGNSEKRRYLRKQGVSTTVNSRTTEFPDLLYRQLPNKPPQVVLNSLTSPGSALLLIQCALPKDC